MAVLADDLYPSAPRHELALTRRVVALTVDADFAFSLALDGNTARMTGQAFYQRTALDLGQASDPNADWVSEDVTVDVVVVATRND